MPDAITALPPALRLYLAGWLIACSVALVLCLRRPADFTLFSRAYWRLLAQPWKLGSFGVALVAMVGLAPYSGDPTWDYLDALFMSALAFGTAPWSVGVLARFTRKRASVVQTYVALCIWMFSASWSYDLYLLLRDGYYPVTWIANIGASSFLYLLAGLLWNLESRQGDGLTFAFLHEDWPGGVDPSTNGFTGVALLAVPLILLVAGLMLLFFWPQL